MYVLRRGPEDLGAVEAVLVEQALDRTPPARSALRRRLLARFVAADPTRARKRFGALTEVVADASYASRASAFTIGLIVPASDDYADFAAALRSGLEAGLANAGSASLPAVP